MPPRGIHMWDNVIERFLPYLPVSMLEKQTRYVTFCIDPHPIIAEINKNLREAPFARRKPFLSTWMGLYDRRISLARNSVFYKYPRLLRNATESSGEITIQAAQKSLIQIFEVAVRNDSPHHHHVNYFMGRMGVIKMVDSSISDNIVRGAIECIDSLRTPYWISNEHREPEVLPDTLPLRLLLLPDLLSGGSEAGREEKCKQYADQIASIVDELLGTRYHHRLEFIKKSLSEVPNLLDRIFVALRLGDVSGLVERYEWADVRVYLRIELAEGLIGHVGLKNTQLQLRWRVERLVDSWKRSDDEEVRRIAFRLAHNRKPMELA